MAQAARAAFHSSIIVALPPPSLPVLNCPFLIFSASSIPEIVTTVLSNRLNPSIGRIHVPVPAEKEIHRLARFVDGAVHPLSVSPYNRSGPSSTIRRRAERKRHQRFSNSGRKR